MAFRLGLNQTTKTERWDAAPVTVVALGARQRNGEDELALPEADGVGAPLDVGPPGAGSEAARELLEKAPGDRVKFDGGPWVVDSVERAL